MTEDNKDKLKLLKRYQYDLTRQYDADPETRTITNLVMLDVLDVYEYDGTTYIVFISWYNKEYDEHGDYYYRSLLLKVYPVDAADVDDETRVRAIMAEGNGFKKELSVGPYLPTSYGDDRGRDGNYDCLYFSTRSEENFTKDIRSRVIFALNEYLAEKS